MLTKKQLPQFEFTKEGFARISQELIELQKDREMAVDDLAKARSMGDLSENGYYKAAKAKLVSIDARIKRVNLMIKYAKVYEKPGKDHVSFGSMVTINDGKNERTFQIVGKEEADPLQGKISTNSPIGFALLDKKVGQTVEVTVPSGKITYKIIGIE